MRTNLDGTFLDGDGRPRNEVASRRDVLPTHLVIYVHPEGWGSFAMTLTSGIHTKRDVQAIQDYIERETGLRQVMVPWWQRFDDAPGAQVGEATRVVAARPTGGAGASRSEVATMLMAMPAQLEESR